MRTSPKWIYLLFLITHQHVISADTLYIYDYNTLNQNRSLLQSVLSYQGIVNRCEPKLMVQFNEEDYPFTDLLKEHFTEYVFIDIISDEDLFTRKGLRQYCNDAFYYRESLSLLSENCAVTYAGLHDAVMVEDAAVTLFNTYGFNIIADMRDYSPWNNVDSCSSWLLDIARNDTTINRYFYGVAEGYNGRNKAIDFMVQQRMVCFILDSYGVNVDPSHFQKYQVPFLQLFPPYSVSHGWWSKEVKDIEAISSFGHTSANQGENVSFWNRLPTDGPCLQRRDPEPLPDYDSTKTYMFFTFSQGDAMRYCQRTNYEKYSHLDDSGSVVSKTIPFGLMHNTVQLEIQPFIPYFHYKQAMDNEYRIWFSGKGYGYSNPTTLYENGFLDGYAERSVDFLFRSGMIDLMINDNQLKVDNDNVVLKAFLTNLEHKPRSVILKHSLNDQDTEDDEAWVFEGIPVFADPVMAVNNDDGGMMYSEMMEAIYISMQKRDFFYVFLKHTNQVEEVKHLVELIREDERFDDLVILHPDVFIEFYRSVSELGPYTDPCIPIQKVKDPILKMNGNKPGKLTWQPVDNESEITHYAIWCLDRYHRKLSSSLARVPAGINFYEFTDNISIPEGTRYIGVYASWRGIDAFEGETVRMINATNLTNDHPWPGCLSVYPNPNNGTFHLDNPGEGIMEIFDIRGNMIRKDEYVRGTIYLPHLRSGTYILRITDNKGRVWTDKITILEE